MSTHYQLGWQGSLQGGHCQYCGQAFYTPLSSGLGHVCPPLDPRIAVTIREILKERDAIRLKHITEKLKECEKRPEEVVAVATVLLTAEKKAIEEFLYQ